MPIPSAIVGIFSASVMVLGAGVVSSQDYPNRPIRIVTSGAGAGSDFTSRQVAQGISAPLGQPVIVDNRTSGVVRAEFLSKAPPDGYSLVVTGGSFWTFPLMEKVPYDVVADFSPVSLLAREVLLVAVHPSMPVKSVKELIALAKARPGVLNYAHAGLGSSSHLAGELFKSMSGINIVTVPYKGSAPAIAALLSGEIQLVITDMGLITPLAKSGKLRILAVTSEGPSALIPEVVTVAASGLPGYEMTQLTGMFAPGKTPRGIISRLNQEIVRSLNRPEVKERFLNNGSEVVTSSPEQFAATLKSEIAKWGKVIKDAGIKAN